MKKTAHNLLSKITTLPREERCGPFNVRPAGGGYAASRRRLCCLRRETAFSPESAAGSSEAGSNGSPFCASSRRGADRRWRFGASFYYRVAGDGQQAFPTRERHRVLDQVHR